MGKNIVLVYTCTVLIISEIYTCNVPTYEEFNVIIFNYVCLWSRDTNCIYCWFQRCCRQDSEDGQVWRVDDDSVETVVRRVNAEVLALPRSNDFDLNQFTFEKIVANTCPTLLALVSQLVSNRELNKSTVGLTISQCIQQHISNSTNQTKPQLLWSCIINLVVRNW